MRTETVTQFLRERALGRKLDDRDVWPQTDEEWAEYNEGARMEAADWLRANARRRGRINNPVIEKEKEGD
jgi:hypothetical protein